ncbi:hypothetical protein [Paenibacillus periandrae]|uniref:hypothetical protein n=1 Tax=Paenibacillus periandrae TaxID=1761741 RepID=UPI001F089686|nr:hypothetical protein [Paenibacillus periandrae]
MDIVESGSFHKLLAALFLCSVCFIAVLYLVISIIRNNFDSKAMKFFGILVISGFALFINNWTIYVLVTLVASTLITVQKFLERILEIIFRHKNYTLSDGTNRGRVNKNLKEVEQISTAEAGILIPEQIMDSEFSPSATPLEEQVNFIMSIEDKMLHAMELEKEVIKFDEIKFNQILTTTSRKELLLDAILISDSKIIILEVQPAIKEDLLYKSIGQLKKQCYFLKKYLKRDNDYSEVSGILCTLNYPEFTESVVNGVGLLKYDLERQCFVNLYEVLEWLGRENE